MRIAVGLLALGFGVLCAAFFLGLRPEPAGAGDLNWYRWKGTKGIPFGGYIDEMQEVKIIDADKGKDRRIIYGNRQGQVRALRYRNGKFQEEWASRPFRAPVSGVFVGDLEGDGEEEIAAYTEFGDIAIWKASNYKQIWRSTSDQYASISTMVVANVDDDPQLELVFCAETVSDVNGYQPSSVGGSQEDMERQRAQDISRLFVFDCKNLFVEWNSEPGLTAQSIAVGDLNDDGDPDIVLNTGFVVDATYRRVIWRYPQGFGDKIGYADIDGDGIPELIGEYTSTTRPHHYLRFFDVDLQSESFLSTTK